MCYQELKTSDSLVLGTWAFPMFFKNNLIISNLKQKRWPGGSGGMEGENCKEKLLMTWKLQLTNIWSLVVKWKSWNIFLLFKPHLNNPNTYKKRNADILTSSLVASPPCVMAWSDGFGLSSSDGVAGLLLSSVKVLLPASMLFINGEPKIWKRKKKTCHIVLHQQHSFAWNDEDNYIYKTFSTDTAVKNVFSELRENLKSSSNINRFTSLENSRTH